MTHCWAEPEFGKSNFAIFCGGKGLTGLLLRYTIYGIAVSVLVNQCIRCVSVMFDTSLTVFHRQNFQFVN